MGLAAVQRHMMPALGLLPEAMAHMDQVVHFGRIVLKFRITLMSVYHLILSTGVLHSVQCTLASALYRTFDLKPACQCFV